MKVAITTSSVSRLAGGLFTSVRIPAVILKKHYDIDIRVFGLFDGYTYEDAYKWGDLPVEAYRVKCLKSFGFTTELGNGIKKFNPDIIHTHGIWLYDSLFASIYCQINKKIHLISPRGMLSPIALNVSRKRKIMAGLFYQNWCLNRANCLHALNPHEASCIKKYGVKKPVCIIPNGIDLPKNAGSPPPWDGKIKEYQKVLLYLGRIHPIKGLKALIKGWALVCKKLKSNDWTLVIAGWGISEYEAELKAIVMNENISSKVLFTGPLYGADKHSALQNASGFILPSTSEAFSVAILEAWANKLPVLATVECNIQDGINSNAVIIIGKNDESIAIGIEKLMMMTFEERRWMGLNGFKLVNKKYTWAHVVTKINDLYKWTISRGKRPKNMI